MNETSNNPSQPGFASRLFRWALSWRILRRTLITLAVMLTLIAAIYTEENWRGQRAWAQCKRDLIAAGYEMDWHNLIPPPVPDEQNVFKAPHMQEWFVRPTGFASTATTGAPNSLQALLTHPNLAFFGKESRITNAVAANEFLDWSRQFTPEFDLIRTALQRPSARMEGDYSKPFEMPIPNFVMLRCLAQTFAQRAHCHLLLGQPNAALADLTFIHATRKLLFGQSPGKPMTLVAAMIHVAITGLYTSIIEEGLHNHAWQEAQLLALESQLAELNLPATVYEAFSCELTASSHAFEHEPFSKLMNLSLVVTNQKQTQGIWHELWNRIKGWRSHLYDAAPRGWLLQNMVTHARLERLILESMQGYDTNMQPQRMQAAQQKLEAELERPSRFNLIARIAIPNFFKARLTTARNQTTVSQARIVCALERFHRAQGQYPETLAALSPQFLTSVPNDLIGGQPFKYRRHPDGSALLYSIGWNETDDGGTAVLTSGNNPTPELTQGDWVWTLSPAK